LTSEISKLIGTIDSYLLRPSQIPFGDPKRLTIKKFRSSNWIVD